MQIATQCPCCASNKLHASPAILMPFIAHRVFNWQPVTIDESWQLNTVKNGNAYATCNSLECSECEFVFLDMRFSDEEMGRLYIGYRDEIYTKLRDTYEPGYASRNVALDTGCNYISKVEEFLSPMLSGPISVLDWGGDTGINTPFRTPANQIDIYDISNKAVLAGTRRVSREQALSGNYALIVCSNVMEHVSDPVYLLSEIKAFAMPDSLIYVEVPFEDVMKDPAPGRALRKKHWHEHINFFSEKALDAAFTKAGLSIIRRRVLDVTVAEKSCSIFQIAAKPVVA